MIIFLGHKFFLIFFLGIATESWLFLLFLNISNINSFLTIFTSKRIKLLIYDYVSLFLKCSPNFFIKKQAITKAVKAPSVS